MSNQAASCTTGSFTNGVESETNADTCRVVLQLRLASFVFKVLYSMKYSVEVYKSLSSLLVRTLEMLLHVPQLYQ